MPNSPVAGDARERLRAAGSFGSGSVRHRVALGGPADVDAELIDRLRQAYEANG